MNRLFLLLFCLVLSIAGCSDKEAPSVGGELNPSNGGNGTGTTATVASVVLSSPNSTLCANGSGDPSSSRGILNVNVTNSAGEPLANRTVNFSQDAGTIAGSTVTDVDGNVKVDFTAPNTMGTVNITAATGGVQSNSISIDVTQGPPATIQVIPMPNTVGPLENATIKAVVTDGNGFAVAPGTIVSANTTVSGSGATLVEFGETDNNGLVTFTTYRAGASPGSDTIFVRSGSASSTATIEVINEPRILNQLSLSTNNSAIIANGQDFTTLQVSALDANGLGVEGITVNFSTTLGSLSSQSVTTDLSGHANVTLTAGTAMGTARILAQTNTGFADIKLITFLAGPPANVYLSVFPTQINAGGTATVQATVLDEYDNAVKDEELVFKLAVDDTSNISPVTATTDASGRASVTYTAGANPGTYTISALTANSISPILKPQVTVVSNNPGSVSIETTTSTISLGGSTALTITVFDNQGQPVPNQSVNLTTNGVGNVPSSVTTGADGIATALFDARYISGDAVVTATVGTLQGTVNLTILPGSAGVLNLVGISPENGTIHIQQSNLATIATLTFTARDSFGNPAPNGTLVTFSLSNAGTGGGEALTTDGSTYASTVSASTISGQARAVLRSGTVSGVVDVIASIDSGAVKTIARVNIVGAMPDAEHISLAATRKNLAGFVYDNLESELNVSVADRFGNVPADGTLVTFYSECGSIGLSSGFMSTLTDGIAKAILRTANPRPGADGLCNVVVTTTGDDTWSDLNGNGRIDAGEPCLVSKGEPYIDKNSDGVYNGNDVYIDADGDGAYDGPDACAQNVVIWNSMDIMFSAAIGPINLSPNSFAPLLIGQKQTFTYDIQDVNGNALVAGTTVEVTTTKGTLTGATKITLSDEVSSGKNNQVTLWSSLDSAASPEIAEVKVTITPPADNNNRNGATVYDVASGIINQSPAP